MTRPILEDAFAHHVWATISLIDACAPLTPDQRETHPVGTYGSIIDTLRHIVGADAWYLFVMTSGEIAQVEEATMGLSKLRVAMERNGAGWTALLAGATDPDHDVVAHRDDGSEGHAPLGIRLAQALHHGTDHRSQVCTALTTIGIDPPAIDVWDYAEQIGRYVEIPPPS